MSHEKMRCYLARWGDGWRAACIDADLDAHARTPEQARAALDALLESYCHDRQAAPGRPEAHRRSLTANLRYWRARFARSPSGEPLAYTFHWPPILLFGLA